MLGHNIYTRRKIIYASAGLVAPILYLLTRPKRTNIPFLITADVHDRSLVDDELSRCLDSLALLNMKITFLVTATLAKRRSVAATLRRMAAEGHEVGCHGLVHDAAEDYLTNPSDVQDRNLSSAKGLLEDAIGNPVTVFRAPAFRISSDTLSILDRLGFTADLSICSQRLPLLSSQIGNYHWMFAPIKPYHPNPSNCYAKGNLSILEIPTSAALLPLMSSLNSVSVTATKVLTQVMKWEAELVERPIVYQCHHEDFVHNRELTHPFKLTWRSLVPNSRSGIPLRWALQETDGDVLYRRNQEFLAFLKRIEVFRFHTVKDYLGNKRVSAG